MRKDRTCLFNKELEKVSCCPICGDDSIKATKVLEVYSNSYFQCENCSHCYVMYRPSKKLLDKFYAENKGYQNTYTDKKSLFTRINQVVIPKAEYVIKQYENIYATKPTSILDVGSGSRHFVYDCRKLGINAEGIKISKQGREFCKENFDIELHDTDFTKSFDEFPNYDIITFWGVIEHVTDPAEMLKVDRNITH